MQEGSIENYLKNVNAEECENCGETIKILQFAWGDSETHESLITILNTILEKDEMLSDPLQYDKLKIKYCEHCQAVNLSIK